MDYNRRPLLLPLVTVLMMCPRNSSALEVYKFYEGRDGTIEFYQPLSRDSTFEYEVHLVYTSCYFYKNGNTIPGCLTPQQSIRFSAHGVKTSTYLTVILNIHNINVEDSQLYLFALREDRNGESHFFTQEAYIKVLRPPSPARCIMKHTEYSAAWNEVNCTSLLGSDGEGSLYCFQDAKKIPYKGTPVKLNDHVTWIFWMNALLPINCCSYEATFAITSESCSQFVYDPPTHIHESEDSRNPSSSHSTTMTAEPGTTEEKILSKKITEESNSATITSYAAFATNTLIALAISFTLFL